ncbi:hypothetical protein CYMTET_15215 [Cymbomonas tetramitiformis]|uniref:Uncharacterized protein n=1 Tax=Cymbomonas tetramitiformis TaxID=36881 RepID=A0AAE0GEX1_9CHLO|nr:hypothetical protein CYMTET_15215 [Cymbomonas tetramitiformis]
MSDSDDEYFDPEAVDSNVFLAEAKEILDANTVVAAELLVCEDDSKVAGSIQITPVWLDALEKALRTKATEVGFVLAPGSSILEMWSQLKYDEEKFRAKHNQKEASFTVSSSNRWVSSFLRVLGKITVPFDATSDVRAWAESHPDHVGNAVVRAGNICLFSYTLSFSPIEHFHGRIRYNGIDIRALEAGRGSHTTPHLVCM